MCSAPVDELIKQVTEIFNGRHTLPPPAGSFVCLWLCDTRAAPARSDGTDITHQQVVVRLNPVPCARARLRCLQPGFGSSAFAQVSWPTAEAGPMNLDGADIIPAEVSTTGYLPKDTNGELAHGLFDY